MGVALSATRESCPIALASSADGLKLAVAEANDRIYASTGMAT